MAAYKQPLSLNEQDAPVWRVKVDYLTLVSNLLIVPPDPDIPFDPSPDLEGRLALQAVGAYGEAFSGSREWRRGHGRQGYTRSIYHSIGVTIFYGHPTFRPIAEFGGAACDALNSAGVLIPIIQRYCDCVSRLDLAADLTCSVSPQAFVEGGVSSRYAALQSADSATGSTRYIGSPTSDRRARIYRYAEPHPRSDALRVEIVLRRELAKSASTELCSRTLADVFASAALPFNFGHAVWRHKASSSLPRLTLKHEPTSASRLRWLIHKIKPSLLEAHRDGLIDLATWLAEAEKT